MIYSLKTRQICFFYIAFLPVVKFFLMPSIISSYAGEDTWISLLINCVLDFVTVACLVVLTKNETRNFVEILEDFFGKVPTKVLLFVYLLYFMLKSIMPISEQKDYVVFTLYLNTSSTIMFLPFFIIPIYLSLKKLRVIGRCADAIWIFAIIGYLLIFSLSIGNIDIGAILPIGKAGIINILKGSFSGLTWFGDCAYFLFFIGNYKHGKKDTKRILASYALALSIVLIFGFIFWCSFSSIAFRQRFALTEISKYMTVINNIGRFDYFAIFFLLFTAMVSASLPIFFSSILLNRILKIKNIYVAPLILTTVNVIITILFFQHFAFIENLLTKRLGAMYLIFGNVIPILIAMISNAKKKEQKYEIQKN